MENFYVFANENVTFWSYEKPFLVKMRDGSQYWETSDKLIHQFPEGFIKQLGPFEGPILVRETHSTRSSSVVIEDETGKVWEVVDAD